MGQGPQAAADDGGAARRQRRLGAGPGGADAGGPDHGQVPRWVLEAGTRMLQVLPKYTPCSCCWLGSHVVALPASLPAQVNGKIYNNLQESGVNWAAPGLIAQLDLCLGWVFTEQVAVYRSKDRGEQVGVGVPQQQSAVARLASVKALEGACLAPLCRLLHPTTS